MKDILILGMPHLLSNFDLNLNHIAKIFGDNHWRYMDDTPSKNYIDNNRIYQSFLRIDFDINDKFKEDDQFEIKISGNYIDDYIFCTNHNFGNNNIKMYTIGIYMENGRIQKAKNFGKKNSEFWLDHKNKKTKLFNIKNKIDFPTYYNIDFNCAQILYCANYLKFIYQYCDVFNINANIKNISYFGNIEPKAILSVATSENQFVIMEKDRLIASVDYVVKD
jgi:hypothetical protein